MKRATERVGNAAYDMGAYVSQVDYWGRAAAAALRVEDLRTLADARVLDAELDLGRYLGPLHGIPLGIKDIIDVAGLPSAAPSISASLRRGFRCMPGPTPTRVEMEARTRWRIGCVPAGRRRWSRRILTPRCAAQSARARRPVRISTTCSRGRSRRALARCHACDLFLSTDTNTRAAHLPGLSPAMPAG